MTVIVPLALVPAVEPIVIRSFGSHPCSEELVAEPLTVIDSFAPGLAQVAGDAGALVFGELPLYVATNL